MCVACEMSVERDNGFDSYAGPERRRLKPVVKIVPVRLIRKYAEIIDGVDLSAYNVGDRVPAAAADAKLLLAEGWAVPVERRERRSW